MTRLAWIMVSSREGGVVERKLAGDRRMASERWEANGGGQERLSALRAVG